MKHLGRGLALLLAACLCLAALPAAAEEPAAYTDVVILTTTDMHGKCWDTNILTGSAEKNNLLRASTAVKQFREEYGAENVLLIDNGDLYQGTQVSEYQLLQKHMDLSQDPPVMAVCLREMGYTASVLGNHEFNYPWEVMSETYRWLEEGGVPVLAANICYDGTLEGTEAGQNAFTPYIIRTVTVNGHEHKIGILGLENCDITRWDLPYNYPGLQFVHPGNDSFSMAEEAKLFLPEMKTQGCEFIICSYHGGLGDIDKKLVFGANSESQAMRLIKETADIDFLINGHDHSSGYSNIAYTNAEGRKITVVNGGSQDLTRTVFRFTEDENGALAWERLESDNLKISSYDVDEALQEKVRPYAELAEAYVEQPVATAVGGWDGNRNFHTEQTDSIDLTAKAFMEVTTLRLQELAEDVGEEELLRRAGTDHLDTDMAVSSVVVSGKYVVQDGPVSMKDIYRLYKYSNDIMVLPLTGAQIRAVIEENAANRLNARVHGGQVYFYAKGDTNTHLVFGGLNFTYDLAQPEGSRVTIEGFANGRSFEEDKTYLVAVNNYLLGNARCGLRGFSAEDTLWPADGEAESAQSMLAAYMTLQGTISPEAFNWHWEITWSGDPDSATMPEDAGAVFAEIPEDGHRYFIYHEADQAAMTGWMTGGGLDSAAWEAQGPALKGPKPEKAIAVTAHVGEDGVYRFTDEEGRWLVSASGGGLSLTDTPAWDDLARWTLEPAYGGWNVINVGAKKALEVYSGNFTTFSLGDGSLYIFNFYEPAGE